MCISLVKAENHKTKYLIFGPLPGGTFDKLFMYLFLWLHIILKHNRLGSSFLCFLVLDGLIDVSSFSYRYSKRELRDNRFQPLVTGARLS